MERIVYQYLPKKQNISWWFCKPAWGERLLFGEKAEWKEDIFSGGFTIIGRTEKGLFCDYRTSLEEIISNDDLEKRILERIQRQAIAQEADKKKSIGRAVVTAAVYGGYIAGQLITGNRSSAPAGTAQRKIDSINKELGIDNSDIYFDEEAFRKKFLRIEGKDQWARFNCELDFSSGVVLWRDKMPTNITIFCGLPSNYSGNVDRRCCITIRYSETNFEIVEYADVQTMEQAWSALKSYGFA